MTLNFYASAVCATTEALCLCLLRPGSYPVPSVFLSLRKSTERIF